MPEREPYDPKNPFKVGNSLCWLHGDNYRVATVVEVEEHRVKLSGLTADYWKTKKSLLPRLDVTPVRGCGF